MSTTYTETNSTAAGTYLEIIIPPTMTNSTWNQFNRVIIGNNLNINSIRNKFDSLNEMVKENVDVLVTTEIKIDGSFPDSRFRLNDFSHPPYRLDRTSNSGGVMIFVRGHTK